MGIEIIAAWFFKDLRSRARTDLEGLGTAVPIRDWSSGPKNCANWESPTRLSRPLPNLIRRDSCCSTTCRIRQSQQPTKPQPNNPHSRVRGAKASLTRNLSWPNHA